MACDLTKGRAVPCKDVAGGIKAVYFVEFGDLGAVTLTSDEVTAGTATFSAYKYALKGGSSLEATFNVSRENGTTFFTQTITLNLTKLTKEDNKELKLIAYGRPHVFVEDYQGNAWVCGLVNGCDVTGGNFATGAAMGDKQGYTLTLEAEEITLPNFLLGAVVDNPFAGITGWVETIVSGTNS